MDERVNAKRQKHGGTTAAVAAEPSAAPLWNRDCYHSSSEKCDYESFHFHSFVTGDAATLPASPPVQVSWLTHLKWISSADTMQQSAQAQTQTQPLDTVSIPDSTANHNPLDNDDAVQNEVAYLNQKLLQVKRRLKPAAERCANAVNNMPTAAATTPTRDGSILTSRSTNVTTGTARQEFAEARRACNPMEVLGEGQWNGLNSMFMNRSAIKLANIDAALGFCLTRLPTTSQNGNNGNKIFVFADLCGAPGGFSEYIQWRCSTSSVPCRGYGMSLMGANEHGRGLPWKLDDNRSRQNCYHICHGADGTGDVQNWDNIVALQQMIRNDDVSQIHRPSITQTNDNTDCQIDSGRVHLVVADGGLDAQRDSENQEQVAQKLIVCEVAAALTLLQTQGTLVLKLFGFQTRVMRVVLRHLFLSFHDLIAIKPISSRPASAERYVVCVGFRGNPPGWDARQWCNHMYLESPCPYTDNALLGNSSNFADAERCLARYLNEFDRDLSHLNLKACFSILSYLESKYMYIQASNHSAQWGEFRSNIEAPRINIASYRIAWCLDS
jgi:cap1 methyltransferase